MGRNYTQFVDTFIFRKEWGELFTLLSDEEAGILIKAIIVHTNGGSAGKTLGSYPILRTIAREIITKMERSTKLYLTRTGKLTEAGEHAAILIEGHQFPIEHQESTSINISTLSVSGATESLDSAPGAGNGEINHEPRERRNRA